VPDNLKAGVTHPCRYEPGLNPTNLDMAAFYGTAVIPARSARPRETRREPALTLRGTGPAGLEAPPGPTLRVRRVE